MVFQPLKYYHAKALDVLVHNGLTNITKIEFLGMIQGVRSQASKRPILSAFTRTVIFPFDTSVVLVELRQRVRPETPLSHTQTSSPPRQHTCHPQADEQSG